MSRYLDASFLVSLYSIDANSVAAVRTLSSATGVLLITPLVEVEFVNAIGLQLFRKELSSVEAQSSLKDFERDLRANLYLLKSIPDIAFSRAQVLSRQTTPWLGTRSSDILHVGAALELGSTGLYSFDLRQRKLAQAVKLKLNIWP